MIFGFPSLPTLAAGEALMAKLVAYWRSNPTFGNVQASTPSVHQTASVDAPGITLVANADQPYDVDNVTIRVNTCFNSPGPTNPTQTEVGDPPSG
ncbi:MAG TPA: hypothetical protein VGX23_09690 [Actinocrinis sp.]|nr:hypothetical protein [Actinocrinis sp.]